MPEAENASPALLIGRAADAEILLRGIESGAVKRIWPVGVLSPSPADRGQTIRNIPVLGGIDDIEDVIRDFERARQADRAHRDDAFGVRAGSAARSRPDARPPARHDRQPAAVAGKRRSAAADRGCGRGPAAAPEREDRLRAARSAGEEQVGHRHRRRRLDRFGDLRARRDVRRGAAAGDREFGAGALCRHRSAGRAARPPPRSRAASPISATASASCGLMSEFKPDIVFHAAALKHVPILERDWSEGVKTNIFGSVNVADAALAAGAKAMVMISTDKAIEPVSMLGLTKRFAEMYCQALDHDLAYAGGRQAADAPDLGAVRQRAGVERLGGAEVHLLELLFLLRMYSLSSFFIILLLVYWFISLLVYWFNSLLVY